MWSATASLDCCLTPMYGPAVRDVDAENGDGIFGLARHGGLLAFGTPRRGVLRGAPPVHPLTAG